MTFPYKKDPLLLSLAEDMEAAFITRIKILLSTLLLTWIIEIDI